MVFNIESYRQGKLSLVGKLQNGGVSARADLQRNPKH